MLISMLSCMALLEFYLSKRFTSCDLTVQFTERPGQEGRTDLYEIQEGRNGAVIPLSFAEERQIYVFHTLPHSASMPGSHSEVAHPS